MTSEIVNAFHPDYVKTHMPEFLAHVKQQNKYEISSQNMANFVTKKRKTEPAHGTFHGMTKPLHVMRAPEKLHIRSKENQNMTMAEVMNEMAEMKRKKLSAKQRVDLAPREFNIYSRAGTANVTPKGKKK